MEHVHAADPHPPQLPPHYQVERVLGGGGQATTYAARDARTGAHVAIKVFTFKAVKDYKQLELFRRECQVLKALEHPGIPRLLEEFESDDGSQAFLVMDLVEGPTLKDVQAQGGPLTEEALWSVLWQGAEILRYLHARQPPVVHRDIKPANLIQRSDGTLCLVDFGVVQSGAPAAGDDRTWVGTAGFMAPEQYRGESMPASDVYALGVSVLCLATGQRAEDLPHDGLRLRMEDVAARIPHDLQPILLRMTAAEPSSRPRDGDALLSVLRAARPEEVPAPDLEPATLGGLPAPLQVALGVLLTLVGVVGLLALTVARVVFLPLILSIIGMVAPDQQRQRILARRGELRGVLQEGADNFRSLARAGFEEARAGQQALQHGERSRRASSKGNQARAFEQQRRAEQERMRAHAHHAAQGLRR
jgi:hypothetical protein